MKETILPPDQMEQLTELNEGTLQTIHGGAALEKVGIIAKSTTAGMAAGGFVGLCTGVSVVGPIMSKKEI